MSLTWVTQFLLLEMELIWGETDGLQGPIQQGLEKTKLWRLCKGSLVENCSRAQPRRQG